MLVPVVLTSTKGGRGVPALLDPGLVPISPLLAYHFAYFTRSERRASCRHRGLDNPVFSDLAMADTNSRHDPCEYSPASNKMFLAIWANLAIGMFPVVPPGVPDTRLIQN